MGGSLFHVKHFLMGKDYQCAQYNIKNSTYPSDFLYMKVFGVILLSFRCIYMRLSHCNGSHKDVCWLKKGNKGVESNAIQ